MARAIAQGQRRRPAQGTRGAKRAIASTPERFMRPRVILIAVTAILVCFGLLMIWSASSMTDLASSTYNNDPMYHVKSQLRYALLGLVAAVVATLFDYHSWTKTFVKPLWIGVMATLAMVFLPGTSQDAYGASRWINIGGFGFQPSEFAKIFIVICAAEIAQRYYEERSVDDHEFIKLLLIGVGIPLAAILGQPDKGTTMIVCATLLAMYYLAGLNRSWLFLILGIGLVLFLFLALKDDYSRSRIMILLDPWSDALDSGYQLIQGFYAFGSGGIFGVGLGFSKQKYAYLPMAHNDFIYAIIGEELGLVGTLGLLVLFAVLVWAGFEISRHASDLSGRLIAAGCTSMLAIQLFVNICGVIGIMPMTGKPIPFISYGGSSIIASLLMVGVILSVSLHSTLPETENDRARRSLRVSEGAGDPGLSFVGEPTPRSSRRGEQGAGGTGATSGFRVVEGRGRGEERPRAERDRAGRAPRAARNTREQNSRPRSTPLGGSGSNGRSRIDLGPSATDRLRGRDQGPQRRR